MNLKIDAAIFADEAAWMTKLRAGSGFNPVTGAVQVCAVLGALQLRRTDFEQFRETVIPGEGGGQNTITVDATKLATLLKGATGPALVEVGDSELSITLDKRTVRLRSTGDQFPAWPPFTPTAEPAVLGAAQVARVLVSAGLDDTLPALTAVAFDSGTMVSTDRFRLTRVTYADSGFTALVPGAALRAFAGGTDIVSVELGKHESTGDPLVRLSSGARSIVAPTLDCEFPKWRQLIPRDEAPVSVLLRRADLLAAAGSEQVTLTVDDNAVLVCSADDNGDIEIEQRVAATVLRGDDLPFTVKLSTKYLTECLRNIGCGAVRLDATAPLKPVVLANMGEADIHLIMPIK